MLPHPGSLLLRIFSSWVIHILATRGSQHFPDICARGRYLRPYILVALRVVHWYRRSGGVGLEITGSLTGDTPSLETSMSMSHAKDKVRLGVELEPWKGFIDARFKDSGREQEECRKKKFQKGRPKGRLL